jgi:hypothetical protein
VLASLALPLASLAAIKLICARFARAAACVKRASLSLRPLPLAAVLIVCALRSLRSRVRALPSVALPSLRSGGKAVLVRSVVGGGNVATVLAKIKARLRRVPSRPLRAKSARVLLGSRALFLLCSFAAVPRSSFLPPRFRRSLVRSASLSLRRPSGAAPFLLGGPLSPPARAAAAHSVRRPSLSLRAPSGLRAPRRGGGLRPRRPPLPPFASQKKISLRSFFLSGSGRRFGLLNPRIKFFIAPYGRG